MQQPIYSNCVPSLHWQAVSRKKWAVPNQLYLPFLALDAKIMATWPVWHSRARQTCASSADIIFSLLWRRSVKRDRDAFVTNMNTDNEQLILLLCWRLPFRRMIARGVCFVTCLAFSDWSPRRFLTRQQSRLTACRLEILANEVRRKI